MAKLLPGYKIEAVSEDCPYVAYHHNLGEESEVVIFSVDVSKDFWDGKMTLKEAISDATAKIELLISAFAKDPSIKSRIPRHLIQGYTYQITIEELQDLLSRLVVSPGQTELFAEGI